MDLQTFIQSGLLETYVLGQATAEERSLVERMLSQHVEARTEMSAIEQAMERYAIAQATPPPAWMKGRIMDQLEQLTPSRSTDDTPLTASGNARLFQLLAAALLIAVAFLWYKNSQVQQQQVDQQAQLAAIRIELKDCSDHVDSTRAMARLLRDSDTKPIILTNGGPDGGKAGAQMFNNDFLRETALDLSGLMTASPGKYLQIWAVIDGKPISLGMVKAQAINSWQSLPYHENVQYYAISEENSPQGNPTPTIVVMHS